MPLSTIQLRADHWSKCVLIGSTLLLTYSLLVLAITGHMKHHPHGSHHQERHGSHGDGPCAVGHFAVLGAITGVTGMLSSFRMQRRLAVIFMVLVLLTEVSALSILSYRNAKLVHQCQAQALSATVVVEETRLRLPGGAQLVQDRIVGESVTVNEPQLRDCLEHVRHASVLASLIIGVVACSIACCSSRFANALHERDVEETIAASECAVMVEVAPVMAIVVSQSELAKCEASPQCVAV